MLTRKICSFLLCCAVIVSFSLPISAFGQFASDDEVTGAEVTNGLANEPDSSDKDPFLFITGADPTLVDSFYSVSDEILAASTEELLSYFLGSLAERKIYPFASTQYVEERSRDFSNHPAFIELLSRGDLLPALRSYESALEGYEESREYEFFQEFIEHPAFKQAFANSSELTGE